MSRDAINRYCVCNACRGNSSDCITLAAHSQHCSVVHELICQDSSIITITLASYSDDVQTDVGCCHTSLLAFFSKVFEREIKAQYESFRQITSIRMKSIDQGLFAYDWKEPVCWKGAISWIYTGHIQHDPAFATSYGGLEKTWNLAVDLEMPEFANYLMRMIVGKYTKWITVDHTKLCFREAWYPSLGPAIVCMLNRNSARRGKLFIFLGDVIRTKAPCSNAANARRHSAANNNDGLELSWYKQLYQRPKLCRWIKDLGGLHSTYKGEQPTDPSEWHHYMIQSTVYKDRLVSWSPPQYVAQTPRELIKVCRYIREPRDGTVDDNLKPTTPEAEPRDRSRAVSMTAESPLTSQDGTYLRGSQQPGDEINFVKRSRRSEPQRKRNLKRSSFSLGSSPTPSARHT